jgi:hypothetical protein
LEVRHPRTPLSAGCDDGTFVSRLGVEIAHALPRRCVGTTVLTHQDVAGLLRRQRLSTTDLSSELLLRRVQALLTLGHLTLHRSRRHRTLGTFAQHLLAANLGGIAG